MEQSFTGTMAIVSINGVQIGRMKDINGTESFQRGRVGGLGTIFASEVPVLQFSGTFTCSYYLVEWDLARIKNSIKRNVPTVSDFECHLILQEQGVQIDVFKKVTDALDENGLVIPGRKPFAVIRRAFCDNESFNLAEGQIGGHNQSFQYLDPIIFPN